MQEQHLIYDPSSPVTPERELRPSPARDTFESLLDQGETHVIPHLTCPKANISRL